MSKNQNQFNFVDLDPNVLGSAGIGYTRFFGASYQETEFGKMFPSTGTVNMNSKRLAAMKNNIKPSGKSLLHYTALHEIGHVLGIGSFNFIPDVPPINKPVVVESDGKRYYNGANALREYKSYFPDISNNLIV